MPDPIQQPSIGRDVHFFATTNQPLAAKVTRVVPLEETADALPWLVDLTVFNDDSDVDGGRPVVYRRRRVPQGVFYGAAGTWAWPSAVD